MTRNTKIVIVVYASLSIIAGVTYFVWKTNKDKKPVNKDSKIKTSTSQKELLNTNNQTSQEITTPVNYNSNPLVISTKNKADYISGTLDTMKLKDNKIVSSNTNTPYSIGLLQGVWRMHNSEFDKLKNAVSISNQPSKVKNFANAIIQQIENKNIAMFDPSVYNYQAQWYKDYLNKLK